MTNFNLQKRGFCSSFEYLHFVPFQTKALRPQDHLPGAAAEPPAPGKQGDSSCHAPGHHPALPRGGSVHQTATRLPGRAAQPPGPAALQLRAFCCYLTLITRRFTLRSLRPRESCAELAVPVSTAPPRRYRASVQHLSAPASHGHT